MGTELADAVHHKRGKLRARLAKFILRQRNTVSANKVLMLCCAVLCRKVSGSIPTMQPLGLEPARSTQSLSGFSAGARLPPNERTENTGAAFSSSDYK